MYQLLVVFSKTWSSNLAQVSCWPCITKVANHWGRTRENKLILVKVQCQLWIAEFTTRVLSKGKNKWHWCHSGCDKKGTEVYLCCCHGLFPNNFIHTSKKV